MRTRRRLPQSLGVSAVSQTNHFVEVRALDAPHRTLRIKSIGTDSLLLRLLTVSIAVAEPFPRAIRHISTWNQTRAFNALFTDSIHLAAIVVIVTRWTNALAISADFLALALVVLLTNRRRGNRKATPIKTNLVFASTIGVILTIRYDFNALP